MHDLKRDTELPAPEGLRQSAIALGAEEFWVLRYPLCAWELPGGLTAAEQEIALAILAGQSRREVARARGTSIRTVSNLLSQVFRKLGVRSRIELAARVSAGPAPRRP
jgi:DNA-binding CsgD family transcriptional regulator